jgi:hypothetical protein
MEHTIHYGDRLQGWRGISLYISYMVITYIFGYIFTIIMERFLLYRPTRFVVQGCGYIDKRKRG